MRKDKDFIQWFFLYNSERCELKMQHHPFPSGIPLYNYYIAIFPLPHVFGLRRLQSNPPCSIWLQHIHRMCCLTLPIPPFILIGCGCPTTLSVIPSVAWESSRQAQSNRVWVPHPTFTKQIIWRNCGRSSCPC